MDIRFVKGTRREKRAEKLIIQGTPQGKLVEHEGETKVRGVPAIPSLPFWPSLKWGWNAIGNMVTIDSRHHHVG